MSEFAFGLIYLCCILSGTLLILVATVGELWAVWAKRGYRVQLTLRSLLMALTAASLTLALIAPGLATDQWESAILLGALAFPFLLALVFFAEMLVGELYHTFTGTSSRGMREYRRTEIRVMETDVDGKPVIPDTQPNQNAKPRQRSNRKPSLAGLPIARYFGITRD